jgi:hypothetical protein
MNDDTMYAAKPLDRFISSAVLASKFLHLELALLTQQRCINVSSVVEHVTHGGGSMSMLVSASDMLIASSVGGLGRSRATLTDLQGRR